LDEGEVDGATPPVASSDDCTAAALHTSWLCSFLQSFTSTKSSVAALDPGIFCYKNIPIIVILILTGCKHAVMIYLPGIELEFL
jgi:hypothetical protein